MAKLRTPLTDEEIRRAFATESAFPAVLSPAKLATILDLSPKTIYHWLALGRLEDAAQRQGKHWLIFRDRAISVLFNGPRRKR